MAALKVKGKKLEQVTPSEWFNESPDFNPNIYAQFSSDVLESALHLYKKKNKNKWSNIFELILELIVFN